MSAAGLWLAAAHDAAVHLYGASAMLGIGIGLGYAAVGTMAVQHIEPSATAAAGGVNALVRIVGSSLAGAVAGALLAAGQSSWSLALAAVAALCSALAALAHGALIRADTSAGARARS